MAKVSPPVIRQINTRLSVTTCRRLEAIRATLRLTQRQAIEQALVALERSLTPAQRRTVRFFLRPTANHDQQ